MGYAHGQNNNGREIGYAVEATCDLTGCDTKIDRGLAYCCGSIDGVQNGGMDDEPYCGGYFCPDHLHYLPTNGGGDSVQVCVTCLERQACPRCGGSGDWSGDNCPTCDSHGYVAQRDGKVVESL